jgi:hypothetical protein
MDATERAEVLKQISNVQEDTASVTVQIGGTNDSSGIVEHDSLYIQEAPPRIISTLEDMGYHLAVCDDGVKVY